MSSSSAAPQPHAGPIATCAPWAPSPRSFILRGGAGRGDFFREFRYDFVIGRLSVHDSDPFATGREVETPRVIEQAHELSGATRSSLEQRVLTMCLDEQALKRRCAPGGCRRLTVTQTGGQTTKVEDAEELIALLKYLASLFPELRQ